MNTGIGGTTYNWKTNTFGSNNIMNSFNNQPTNINTWAPNLRK
jgi:hypothetical protein